MGSSIGSGNVIVASLKGIYEPADQKGCHGAAIVSRMSRIGLDAIKKRAGNLEAPDSASWPLIGTMPSVLEFIAPPRASVRLGTNI